MRGGNRRWGSIAAWTLSIWGGSAGFGCISLAGAQGKPTAWNDRQVRALVAAAISRRSRQLADTGLVDYQATAHGYLTFLAQVGAGFPDPPKVVRSDELAVQVYWHAPDLSKQVIIGRRDTLLLPADIAYFRDRYGIIQNNFPDFIRLGEGNDVRDVPHPLGPHGPEDYDYLIEDSLRITVSDRIVNVYSVRVRPRQPLAPRVVGTIYLERDGGALVRMAITFTRAAILDDRIETLAVTLDNALIDRRYWLPHRQELEVVRTTTWLDYPVRGIIRGRWQVCCFQLNKGINTLAFGGPEIVLAPAPALARYPWRGRVLDSLPPDVSVATVADVQRVENDARSVVSAAALARVRSAAVLAPGISDFVRVNRVEGLALGAGATFPVNPQWSVAALGRYGFADQQGKGQAGVNWRSGTGLGLSLSAFRLYHDAGDVAEGSLLVNSIAAQEFGADHTEPYDTRGFGLTLDMGDLVGLRWSLAAVRESERSLSVHAVAATGTYGPTIPAFGLLGTRVSLAVVRPSSLGPWGMTWRARLDLRGDWYTAADTALPSPVTVGRAFVAVGADQPLGPDLLALRATVGGVTANGVLPAQDYVYLGGPVSGPGYAYHAFVGQVAASLRAEWRLPIPVPSIPLGLYGMTPPSALLAPYLSADYVNRSAGFRPLDTGWYPAAGVAVIGIFDLLRLDVARGLRSPGQWTFWFDVTPELWGIM
jgi:hypothetical protein